MENLIFRRQFLISSKKLQFEDYWKVLRLNRFQKECFIYSHQDLEIVSAANEIVELHLLGYIIDPFHPEKSNKEILDSLLQNNSFELLLSGTYTFGGRFALVYNTKDALKVFHDATGFREVYYYHHGSEMACGSTPNIISRYFAIERNDDPELNEFFNSPEFKTCERAWIGTKTIFKEVFKLLPNHYLDLAGNKVHRFWPNTVRQNKSLEEVATLVASIISGTYECAVRRYQLEHSLTSGWDSRVLLACSRHQIHNMRYYFYRGFKVDCVKDGVDYLVARQISDEYNLSARFVTIEDCEVDRDFEKIFYDNNVLSRPKLLKGYYDAYLNKLENTVTVSGTMGNEILRIMRTYRRNVKEAATIAKMIGYERFPYIVNSIDEWIDDARTLKDDHHVLIDYFFWEQYFGNWGSLSASEQDIVREELRPLNNRALISETLCLRDRNRYRDNPRIYRKIIEMLWPELLKFDMDMSNRKFKKILRFIGLERISDMVYQSFRN